jgi:two-component system CheB/CheR fusion protein
MSKRKSTPKKPNPSRPSEKGDGVAHTSGGESVNSEVVGAQAEDEATEARKPGLTLVGIGASAGGLEAFTSLIENLPVNTGLALVFVQHLSPTHESMLPQLLSEKSSLTVVQATDGTVIEADHIYVIPPNTQMGFYDGRLRLTPRPEGRSRYTPIDYLFHSLAEHSGNAAIGVVLSGTSSDGAAGLRELKAVGGITFAQDPETARYDAMPRAAIATGAVDRVLPPQEIAGELVEISRHPYVRHVVAVTPGQDIPVLDDKLPRIFALLRSATGVDFTHYKMATIKRRLQRRMALHKITSVDRYLRFLQENPPEVLQLYQDILIHVTRFFREPDTFKALTDILFPELTERAGGDNSVRIWVPGCSTGEDAYSVAIALLEYLGDDAHNVPIQVFATDVSETAVEQARTGAYAEAIEADVSPERLQRFFTKFDGQYRISKMVRDVCVFARQDVTHDPPFSKLDLIFCRNLLIYLGSHLQKKLMTVFHYALKPSGFLVLGAAETVGAGTELFRAADRKHRIYRRRATDVVPSFQFPLDYVNRAPRERRTAGDSREGASVLREADRLILEKYAPPGVIVTSDLQIVHFRGQTGLYLEPAPGDASLNLLKMTREGLLHGLRAAITEARKQEAPARRDGLQVRTNGGRQQVAIEVIPLQGSGESQHLLILFHDAGPAAETSEETPPAGSEKSAKTGPDPGTVRRLEQELAASREYLQSIIQDLEAANEELQSANEEILSSNEELQSTNEELDTAKEELQSTNEELNTLNEELQGRNEEMAQINSDLTNLLASVQIAIVMVSSELRIRRFTPMAERVLNLIPSDIGRPISHIKPNFDLPNLDELIGQVVDNVTVMEREVHDREGSHYLLRIRPYKGADNRIDGAVLSVFDVTTTRRQEAQLQIARGDSNAVLSAVPEPLLVLDSSRRVRIANRAFCDVFRYSSTDILNRQVFEMGEGEWNVPALRAYMERAGNTVDQLDTEPMELRGRDGVARQMRLSIRRIEGLLEGDTSILLLFQNVGPHRSGEAAPTGVGTMPVAVAPRRVHQLGSRTMAKSLQNMTRAELIREIQRLRRAAQPAPALQAVSQELAVHQEELRVQTDHLQTTQQELEASWNQYAELYDFAPVGYASLDNRGVVTAINLTGAAMLGQERERILGYPLLSFVMDADRRIALEHLSRCQQAGAGEHVRHELRLRSGVPIEISTRVVRRWEEPAECRCALIDLTERKRAEESLRQAERLASLGTMAAGIAHEINNPLNGIMLTTEYVQQIGEGEADPEIMSGLAAIMDETRRAAAIVKGVLRFSRNERTAKVTGDLNEVIRKSAQLAGIYLTDAKPNVTLELADGLPSIAMNTTEIEQLFVNLIKNAAEAGGAQVQITVRSWASPGGATAEVEDNGPGIAQESLPHVFDPFFSTRRHEGGTGLGLSICHGIVAEHGGTIAIRSRPGEGTAFTVHFPAAALSNTA